MVGVVAVILVAAVLLMSLGGRSGEAGETGGTGESLSPVIPADWVRYENGPVSIAAPAHWIDVTEEDALIEWAMDTFAGTSANAAAVAETYRPMIDSGMMPIFLVESDTGNNVNITVESLPGNIRMSELERLLTSQLEMLGIDVLDTEMIRLPVGESLKVTMSNNLFAGRAMTQYAYVILSKDTMYTATLTQGLGSSGSATSTFDGIIQSFRIDD
jgi:hypothetical protein